MNTLTPSSVKTEKGTAQRDETPGTFSSPSFDTSASALLDLSQHIIPSRLKVAGHRGIPTGDPRRQATSPRGSDTHATGPLERAENFIGRPFEREAVGNDNNGNSMARPVFSNRAHSTPLLRQRIHGSKASNHISASSSHIQSSDDSSPTFSSPKHTQTTRGRKKSDPPPPSQAPMTTLPLPPFSMPSYLQLELASSTPSSLCLFSSSHREVPYEATSIKAERLFNFLILPLQLERVLLFGVFACVDAWLYNFTILPIRFCMALRKLLTSIWINVWDESKFLIGFIPLGLSRLWERQRGPQVESSKPTDRSDSPMSTPARTPIPQSTSLQGASLLIPKCLHSGRPRLNRKHRRASSKASTLIAAEKADILRSLLIIASTTILMRFDASMMYHSIRGQATIKLYVIYNVLEVFDRLLSAIGQDILECLFSAESLSRHPNGRSKILRPMSLFPLALIYVLIHATALYYQSITLNVAVNSYSNALLTLLMSNQFVEIKSTVFKRIEKENLFQMTCADVVERFQLWLMLMIIASRNIIETTAGTPSSIGAGSPPPSTPSLLPFSFTLFPSISFTQILNPFILVLGTETLVDWLKHAYITKFNNVKPNLYGRFLDVLAKDYYGNAFMSPNLTKRIGLPVIPLTCLAVRAAVQTYHMFREHIAPAPLPPSAIMAKTAGTISEVGSATATTLHHAGYLISKTVGEPKGTGLKFNQLSKKYFSSVTSYFISTLVSADVDTALAWATTFVILVLLYLVLLAAKLILGMTLLRYARGRYSYMKSKENESTHQEGKRTGGWGTVEVDEGKRRWIYTDDPERLKMLREREAQSKDAKRLENNEVKRALNYEDVERYKLGGSKRIW